MFVIGITGAPEPLAELAQSLHAQLRSEFSVLLIFQARFPRWSAMHAAVRTARTSASVDVVLLVGNTVLDAPLEVFELFDAILWVDNFGNFGRDEKYESRTHALIEWDVQQCYIPRCGCRELLRNTKEAPVAFLGAEEQVADALNLIYTWLGRVRKQPDVELTTESTKKTAPLFVHDSVALPMEPLDEHAATAQHDPVGSVAPGPKQRAAPCAGDGN